MLKAKKSKLSSYLFEEGNKTENDLPPAKQASKQIQNASLDRIVDSYFIQYEKQAMPNPKNKGLYEMIFEAPEDAALGGEQTPPGSPPEAPADDLMAGMGGDTGAGTDPAAGASNNAVLPSPQLNVGLFAAMVARLVNNFDTLVNPKAVTMNRAFAYLSKNYSEAVAKEFLIELENTHDLSPKSLQSSEGEMPPAPFGYGSGPSDGGGGSGA